MALSDSRAGALMPASARMKTMDPAFRLQIATVLQLCEECVAGWETEYKDQLTCSMKRIKLAARFWDHLSENDRIRIANDEAITMAQADVEMEMAKIRYTADMLSRKRRWAWWRTEKYMKKWLGLLQAASQLEFSFQGLCRQVMHEQDSTLIATKLLSDAGLQMRTQAPPETATLMTLTQPGFHQGGQTPQSPNSPAPPLATATSASPKASGALPVSMPAALRGSPSECGMNKTPGSMSRTSSLGPSGFLATPLSADSLSPTPLDPARQLSEFLEPSLSQLPDGLALQQRSPSPLHMPDNTSTNSASPTVMSDQRHGPGHLSMSGLSLHSGGMLVTRPGLKVNIGESREQLDSLHARDHRQATPPGSVFKTPHHSGAARTAGRPDWHLLPGTPSSALPGGAASPGLPCEADIERLAGLEQAAARGSTDAQFEVACMLLEGRGVPRDSAFGISWLKYAASNGHEAAAGKLQAMGV
eukprot:jgi/Ulvmu1/3332/UM155_0015.1